MLSTGTPKKYHFHTFVKAPENPNNKLLSEKKRSLVKWANTAGVSNKNLNYLWDHIMVGNIVESGDTSNNVFTTEIKDLKLTVQSLKATIDELVVSNKFITMKLVEQEKNYLTLINKKMPVVEDDMENYSNTTYDNDYSPPQKNVEIGLKKKNNSTIKSSFDKNLLGDTDDLEEEIAEKNSQEIPHKKRSKNTSDNNDQSPPAKISKTCSEKEKNVLEASILHESINIPDDSQLELDGELKTTNEMLDKLRDYSLLYEVVTRTKGNKSRKCTRLFGINEDLRKIKPETRKLFPIKNRIKLNEIEKLLVDTKFSNQLREYFVAHRPSSAEQMLKKLRFFFDDELSAIYTYSGTKDKMSFKTTLLNNVIFNAWEDCFESDVYKDIFIRFFAMARSRRNVKFARKSIKE